MFGNGMAISMNLMQARNDRRGKRAELPDDVARRLKSCSVLNCEDWRDLSSYTTYHCFPTGEKNQERWELWTQLLRKARGDEAWIPFRGSLVCSHHFRPEDFINDAFSKRRKLIKNAIPSIFPSFQVDLEDPSYQLQDEEPDGPVYVEQETTYEEEYYEYEGDEDSYEEPEITRSLSVSIVPAASNTGNSSGKRLASGIVVSPPPSLTIKPQTAKASNGTFRSGALNGNKAISSKAIRHQEAIRTLSSLPFSLNPDLEIEMVDPEEDFAACKSRISELEHENRTLTAKYQTALDSLKLKYETQIGMLQKRLKDQERLLHVHKIPLVSNGIHKKPRLS